MQATIPHHDFTRVAALVWCGLAPDPFCWAAEQLGVRSLPAWKGRQQMSKTIWPFRWYPGIFAFVISGCAGSAASVQSSSPPVGTYEIWLCKDACVQSDSIQVIVAGHLVLLPDRLPLHQVPDSARWYFERQFFEGEPNACFALARMDSEAKTYAGTAPVGSTHWASRSARPLRIAVSLFDSPDSGHEVEADLEQDRLRGIGTSWGAGGADRNFSTDSVYGRRIGPPQLERCIEAAVQERRKGPAGF